MNRKLPSTAFDFYMALGPARSYQAVAEHFGVIKQTVTRLAARERWQERLSSIDRKARERSDERAAESIEEMSERHLRTLRVMQAKGLETLKSMPLTSAMDAVRTLDLAIRQERTIRGEPTDRTEVSIEEVIRKEYERWMGPADDEEPDPD